jgi:translation elongation factor EF-Ts
MERSDLELLLSRMKFVFQVHNIEDAMIHQPFLMDSDVLVREVLTETGLRVHDFVRFEVGQSN